MGTFLSQRGEQPTQHKQNILPKNVDRAIGVLIAISRDLLHLAHEEHQSLVTLDHMRFAYAQKEKESLSQRYAQASEEFRGRLGAMRMADRGLIAQLNALQTELRDTTEYNNRMVEDIKRRTCATTQSSLFIAQEMGQRALGEAKASNSNSEDVYKRKAAQEEETSRTS